tara:strand:- start:3458 stop:3628 length:171 start_codon:yes stop_codon:yes gene_type:complete
MEDKELIKLFYKVRQAQIKYFKTRKPEDLKGAKRLEKKIDDELDLRLTSLFAEVSS